MILVVNDYDGLYSTFWGHLGMETISDEKAFMLDPDAFKLVCFTGGEDVSPRLYGHANLGSHNSSKRDSRELPIFEMARKTGIPMTGICRGSQFLNVVCGGTMVQHIKKGHSGGGHLCEAIETGGGLSTFQVTSSHHQMSVLGAGGKYLGWSEKKIGVEACVYDGDLRQQNCQWEDETFQELYVTEAFAYPSLNVFAVQHHPEWQNIDCEAAQWTLKMIREICLGEEKAKTAETS